MRKIKFGDLKLNELSKFYVNDAVNKNWVSEGNNVKLFEEKFTKLFNYNHGVMTSSGTSALMCALMSLYDKGASIGDEVIVPSSSFIATSNAVRAVGFVPVFVDIEKKSLNIDPKLISKKITDKTIGIVPVHNMGVPCDMDRIMGIATSNDLIVIEDCCESHGAMFKDRYVGSIGHMGVFSFYTAHIISCGEGGIVVTHDSHIKDLVRSVKSHGRTPGCNYFSFERFGLNCKSNDLCAGVGLGEIEHFWEIFNKRKDNLKYLLGKTKHLKHDMSFILKDKPLEYIVSPHAFPVVMKKEKKDKIMLFLENFGIECKTLFGCIPTQHEAFGYLGYEKDVFPIAEMVGDYGFHFGIHQFLDYEALDYVAEVLTNYVE